MAKLNPTKEWKNKEVYQRITWHFKKENLGEIFDTIDGCINAIDMALTLKDNEMIEKSRDLVMEGNENNRVEFTRFNDRMSAFEKHQREEVEERRKEKEDAYREELIEWLSPFSFIAKLGELLNRSFTQVGAFLWSDQGFQK